jgi:Mn-dependent DtxR family transcriptional regulator
LSTNRSKFYTQSLTLLANILRMINNTSTRTNIAKAMDMRKPHVSYYIRKANENGYIKEVCRDRVKIFELTQRSKNFIDQDDKRIQKKQ